MLHESPKPRDEYISYTCRNMKYRLKFHIWLHSKTHDDVFTMIAVVTLAAKNYFQIVCPNMINNINWDPLRRILQGKMGLQLTQPPVLSHSSGRQCRLSRFQERPWCAYRDCTWEVHEPAIPNEELGYEWHNYCDHFWGYNTDTKNLLVILINLAIRCLQMGITHPVIKWFALIWLKDGTVEY